MTAEDFARYQRETNLYRLAGMLSVIGSFQVNGRTLVWSVTSSDQRLIERIHEIAGCGQVTQKNLQGRPVLYYWSVRNTDAAQFFNQMSNYLDVPFRDEASLKVTQWLLHLSIAQRRPKMVVTPEPPTAAEVVPVVQAYARPSLEDLLKAAQQAKH